jgi:hypothetical protein
MRQHPLSCAPLLGLSCIAAGAGQERSEPRILRVDPRAAASADPPARCFATLRRAFDEARALRGRTNGKGGPAGDDGITIELSPGLHFLDETLVLTPDDSRVLVRGATSPPSIVSGGRRIEGWRVADWKGRRAFVADVAPAKGGGWRFRELFVGGERRARARHPDRGTFSVAGLEPADAARPWNEGIAAFRSAPADLGLLRDDPRADVTVMCRWVESHVRVKSVDLESGLVTLREPTVFKLDPGDPFFLDGAPAFLDAPGEWWLDEDEGRLWYLPLPGEEPGAIEAIAPRLERLVSIEGDPAGRTAGGPGSAFERVVFSHAEWWFKTTGAPDAPRASGFPQAAFGVPAAIEAVGATEWQLRDCTIEHVGTWGVALGGGCRLNVLQRCRLRDLGAGGVKIGETGVREDPRWRTEANSIESCEIGDAGRMFPSAVGVWIGQSGDNVLQANEIHDLLYTGISIGWTWGYGPSAAGGNQVLRNHVHHVGARADGEGPWLSDMGAIYTLGAQPRTRIAGNRFEDVAARTYGGWGNYFDEGSAGITASGNVVARTTHGGFHQHYGRENVVEGNVFAFGRDAQVQRTRLEPHRSFVFRNNVVLWNRGELFAGDLAAGHVALEGNLYWRADGAAPSFGGVGLDEWQRRGFDLGSRVLAPGFLDAERGDFRLAADAPAATILAVFVDQLPLAPPAQGR